MKICFRCQFVLILVGTFLITLSSCGDDEPECVATTPSFEVIVDGETINTGTVVGEISDGPFGGFNIKYIDIFIVFEDGREFTIGIQNIDATVGGSCIENRDYDFDGADEDCFDLDSTTTICNEADMEYINSTGTRFTDFLQDGTLTVTSCNIDKNTISGSFSGEVANFTSTEPTIVSGTFTNILIAQ